MCAAFSGLEPCASCFPLSAEAVIKKGEAVIMEERTIGPASLKTSIV